ncbi:PfkB family carbohydrate kinase [Methylobacterium nigriterrae]|uniref:PfkB family carbohydrate kinase n=1 Tax=Methylobacterium nigriterrae TaxID=3127512 RepID=UPI0030139C97
MPRRARIFVVGSFVAASSVRVARLPEAGQSLEASAFTFEAGGKGLNLAVAAHRLGAAVDGIMAVGNDPLAGLAEPALARAGLPASMLRRFEAQTGAGIGFTQDDGENCLAVFPGANRHLDAASLRQAASGLERADLTLAQFEAPDGAIAEAFRIARGAGRATLLNPSPFRIVTDAILRNTSILVVNASEAAALASASGMPSAGDAVLAARIREQGPDLVVITRGADGATAFPADGAPVRQAAFPVTAVDALGAGDGFAAGLAVALAEKRPLAEAMRRGAACGALVVRSLGVFDALPTREALERFLVAMPVLDCT